MVASIGSGLMPSARAKTLADAARHDGDGRQRLCAGGVRPGGTPSRPLTTSFTVPSPPCTMITSMPSRLAASAISTAWPRWSVCMTVSSTRLSSACASRSRPAAVVEVAFGFTISTARTSDEPIPETLGSSA